MTTKFNSDKNALVDQDIEWRPIATCRPGANVWLLTIHNNSIKGQYRAGDPGIKGWFPFPNIPESMK